MFRTICSLSTVALLALSGAVQAQTATTGSTAETKPEAEAPTTQAPAATSEAPAATTGEGQLDLGKDVTEGPELGQRYSKEKFDDWDLACVKTDQEKDPCSLLQVLHDKENTPMAEFSLFRIANGTQAVAGATIIVPLETLLPAQLTISIDGAPGKRYNYSFCNPIGCVAQIGLTEADIAAFKKGKIATISLRPAPAPDTVVTVEMSLKGFTAGYNVVDVVER
ncbi:invasion associated locus B family protein [Seohaeicola nanhaiensis]|uniref:Invasion associated locus B family protein n=1 Tax=Seohaeicola nanhaiensis TaxID=1387282 RepID=A0ABV9KP01_9RHOB